MATGYTWPVVDGSMTSFRAFALSCARNFGACLHQRDDPTSDAPTLREVSDYHHERIAQTTERVARLAGMTLAEAEVELAALVERVRAENAQRVAGAAEIRNRLEAMRRAIEAWQPPTPQHEGLRQFMLDQITETAKWDGEACITNVPTQTPREWLESERVRALENLEWSREGLRKEEESVRVANAWITALYNSLPKQS